MNTNMRLLVCGDRHWNNYQIVRHHIARLSPSVIIQGGATGADSCAKQAATELNIPCESYPAKWSLYGRAAGPLRNQQMIDEGNPTYVLAFHSDIAKSKGTRNMIARAEKHNIPVELITAWGMDSNTRDSNLSKVSRQTMRMIEVAKHSFQAKKSEIDGNAACNPNATLSTSDDTSTTPTKQKPSDVVACANLGHSSGVREPKFSTSDEARVEWYWK